jgi:hypothetical protein
VGLPNALSSWLYHFHLRILRILCSSDSRKDVASRAFHSLPSTSLTSNSNAWAWAKQVIGVGRWVCWYSVVIGETKNRLRHERNLL